MSQVSLQAHGSVLDALLFAKFSHVTCPYGVTSFPWAHICGRNDLGLVFRSTRTAVEHGDVESLVMEIHAGAELLESQDLGELVKLSTSSNPSIAHNHPVQVVIKCPCLAMRYPKPGNIVRRIQLRFFNESDFNRALDVVNSLGLPTSDNIPAEQPRSRPIPSPTPSMISSISTSSTGTAVSSLLRLAPKTIPLYVPAKDTLQSPPFAPSRPEFSAPYGVDRPTTAAPRSVGALPFSTSSVIRPASASAIPSTRHPSLYVSQVEKQNQQAPQPFLQPSGPGQVNNSIRSPYFATECEAQLGPTPGGTESVSRSLSVSPFFPPKGNYIHAKGSPLVVVSSVNPPNQISKVHLGCEQLSSSQTSHHVERISIPPRRELPFPTPAQKPRAASISHRHPLPAPTLVKSSEIPAMAKEPVTTKRLTPALEPSQKSVAQRKMMWVSFPVNPHVETPLSEQAPCQISSRGAPAIKGPTTPQEVVSTATSKGEVTSSKTTTPKPRLQSKASITRKRPAPLSPTSVTTKRPKMVDQGTQTQTISGRDHTVIRRSTPATNEPKPMENVPTPPLPDHYMDTLDKFVKKHKAKPHPVELLDTPGYAEASEEERDTLLANFVCDNLDNPEFLQLCQDAERAWCRIGLGV